MMDVEIVVTYPGTVYSLTDGTYCFMESISGIGEAQMLYESEFGPFGQGRGILRNYRFKPRTISMTLLIRDAATESARDTDREALLRLLSPAYGEVLLMFTRGDAEERMIYATSQGAAAGDLEAREGIAYQRFEVQWFCVDPLFFEPTLRTATFTSTGVDENVVSYGNALVWPNIFVHGQVTDPVVTINNQSSKSIDLTGHTVTSSATLTIANSTSNKSVYEGATNRLNEVSTASSFGTFYLPAPSPWLSSVTNTIRVDGSGTDGSYQWWYQFYDLYTFV